jgi:hypothetical protein
MQQTGRISLGKAQSTMAGLLGVSRKENTASTAKAGKGPQHQRYHWYCSRNCSSSRLRQLLQGCSLQALTPLWRCTDVPRLNPPYRPKHTTACHSPRLHCCFYFCSWPARLPRNCCLNATHHQRPQLAHSLTNNNTAAAAAAAASTNSGIPPEVKQYI